mgnify:FL=1
MDQERITAEIEYRLAKCVVYDLYKKDLLSEAEMEQCVDELLKLYNPPTAVIEKVRLEHE